MNMWSDSTDYITDGPKVERVAGDLSHLPGEPIRFEDDDDGMAFYLQVMRGNR